MMAIIEWCNPKKASNINGFQRMTASESQRL